MSEQQNWCEEFRSQMPIAENWAYFDHASVAPLSAPALNRLKEWGNDCATNGVANWSHWSQQLDETRKLGAKLINSDAEEIALIRNTTEGVNIVAEGIPWNAGDNVVVPDSEFPSNLFPWLNLKSRGVEVRLVDTENEQLDIDKLAAACDSRTRIVSVSWVGYATGWRNDLVAIAEIAHQHDALFFVDAIQGLGVFPLDVETIPVDFLSADGHKWLLGPEGAGLFFMRKKHLDLLRQMGLGWNSVKHAGNFSDTSLELKESAARYEGGTYNTGGLVALGASLNLLQSFGVDRIANRLHQLHDRLSVELESLGAEIVSCREPSRRSGIISFTLSGENPASIKHRCKQQGVIVNHRAGRIRISPHAYTDEDDIERLMNSFRG